MKKHALTYIMLAAVITLAACDKKQDNKKLQGNWVSKNKETTLKITPKKYIMDGDEQSAEDYFTKGDTIFTSFEGNQPYTKFVIKKLDEQNLNLIYPDSVLIEFSR